MENRDKDKTEMNNQSNLALNEFNFIAIYLKDIYQWLSKDVIIAIGLSVFL